MNHESALAVGMTVHEILADVYLRLGGALGHDPRKHVRDVVARLPTEHLGTLAVVFPPIVATWDDASGMAVVEGLDDAFVAAIEDPTRMLALAKVRDAINVFDLPVHDLCEECSGNGSMLCGSCNGTGSGEAWGSPYSCSACSRRGEISCDECEDGIIAPD